MTSLFVSSASVIGSVAKENVKIVNLKNYNLYKIFYITTGGS